MLHMDKKNLKCISSILLSVLLGLYFEIFCKHFHFLEAKLLIGMTAVNRL